MKTYIKLIAIALAMAPAAPAAARDNPVRDDRREARDDRREQRQDRQKARQEKQEKREDHRDDRQDHVLEQVQVQDRTSDRRNDRHEARRDYRPEHREDRREVRQDRHRHQDRHQAQRYRQLYQQRLLQEQRRWMTYRHHDRFHSTPFSQRYRFDGRYWNTNQYGMEMLRDAANRGYAEGIRAGRADRYDGWRSDYRASWAYREASYGYNGRYIDRDHYRHYFREGFRRGYEDGYHGRSRYGRRDNGQYLMIAAILAAILGT